MAQLDQSAKVSGRVLLADDEDLVRATLRLVLKSEGFQVDEAVDGEDAVRKYLEAPQNYDLILLDLDMPRLSGEEALRKIKHHHEAAKAILLSGGITLPPGCEGIAYLQKPFENRELIRIVRELIAGVT